MRFIRRRLMRYLSNKVFGGILLDVKELSDYSIGDQKGYLIDAKMLLRNGALKNELDRLKNAAGEHIVRHAKDDVEAAWHRGGLNYLEAIDKRLKYLSTIQK